MSRLPTLFLLSPDDVRRAAILHELEAQPVRTHPARNTAALAAMKQTHLPDVLLVAPATDDTAPCSLVSAVRQEAPHVPLLVISTDVSPETRRRLFEVGAHDVLIAPYVPPELWLRIMRLAAHSEKHAVALGGGWHLDAHGDELHHTQSGTVHQMPPSEARLLQQLLQAQGGVIEHDDLAWRVSSAPAICETRAGLASLVARLRRRLASLPGITCSIVAARNRGYRLVTQKPL